jgi:hypothetical protein
MGVGLGAGVAMGSSMMNAMTGAAGMGGGAQAATPPPIPGGTMFHVAVGQNQAGPFDLGTLQGQVTSGQLTRNSLVWKAGMAQWVKAGEVAELAPLFAAVPPPVPQ